MNLREALKQNAREVGFDLVGIAPAKPGLDLTFAREWLERGYGGEMRYLANPKRFDPRTVLPSVKSAICVGLIYDTPFPYSTEVSLTEARSQNPEASKPEPVSDDQGQRTKDQRPARESARAWISRYAWGRDYHAIMRDKLEQLRGAIEGLAPGAETRLYVDTGPVIERAFARFSGAGWMGKNTCIINKEKGSWLFLGVILTSLELEPDLPAPDRCGTCRACLDACPTGALVEPYVMDASRCISYLTIELKGSIPRELRPGVGINIFGCDICQDVCPWNRKDRIQDSGFRSQESSFEPMAISEMKLDTGNWKLETRNSKLQSIQQSPASHQHPAKDELRITNNEQQRLAADNQESREVRDFSIQNPKSQIQNPPSPQHPVPSTFLLFAPPLDALAALSEEDFRRIFAHSPIKRTKYRGWLRNLCVAMGNSGDTRLVPKLKELTAYPDPIVREHAEWALEELCKD